jgi:hypothetical protein
LASGRRSISDETGKKLGVGYARRAHRVVARG